MQRRKYERKGVKYQLNKARTMLAHAQNLVYTLQELMPTQYQKENLEAMLGLFLQAQGHPLPEHSKMKSASALSRFLNINPRSSRDMIRIVRNQVLEVVLKALYESSRGRRPFLQPTFRTPTVTKGVLLSIFSIKRIKTDFGYLRSHIIGLHNMKFLFSIRSNKF